MVRRKMIIKKLGVGLTSSTPLSIIPVQIWACTEIPSFLSNSPVSDHFARQLLELGEAIIAYKNKSQ